MPTDCYSVVARLSVAGFHCWPAAHAARDYLRTRHRHQFVITLELMVAHDRRAIEIHDLIQSATDALHHLVPMRAGAFEFGERSCETIAELLGTTLDALYLTPWLKVTVLEDGEAGGAWTRSRPS